MANYRLVVAVLAAGILAGGLAGCSKTESPGTSASTSAAASASASPSESTSAPDTVTEVLSVAVGTGDFIDSIVGFTATGATNEEASANVIKACQDAGGVECTADEVTNDKLCIVSVASDSTDVVAGGAGKTLEEAKQDALNKAIANGTPEGTDAVVVVSDCPA